MVKRGKSRWKEVLTSIIMIITASVSVFLITMFITEIRSLPQPVLSEYKEGVSCLKEVNFEDGLAVLPFKVKNIGSPGFVSANLNLMGEKKLKEKLLDSKDEYTFIYSLSNKTLSSNFSVSLEYSCHKNVFGMQFNCEPQTYCCAYSEKYENAYNLVSSEC